MKYLDLFSGYGGFSLGIQQAYDNRPDLRHRAENISKDLSNAEEPQDRPTCIGFCEIDKYATQVYKHKFPTHKEYGDITKLEVTKLPNFDLLCGGFPCQAFSIAGNRCGFEDSRGTLIFEVFRILKAKQPKHVLLENVKGLLSHDGGRTFKTIITSLAELGYAVEWQVLNAKNFGVPQNRERVFIIGHLGGFCGRQVFPIGESNTKHLIQLNDTSFSGKRIYRKDGLSPALNTMQGGNRQPKVANTLDANYAKGNSVSSERHTPRTQVEQDMRIRRLTPTECERLMGLKDNWTAEGTEGKISDSQRYKLCGNGVVVNVVEEIIKRLI